MQAIQTALLSDLTNRFRYVLTVSQIITRYIQGTETSSSITDRLTSGLDTTTVTVTG